ncbi:MAG TPA: carbon-nitrogen family hydrolase [Bacillus sp. (in: firmicutes)]|uniref:carbon-nitrogen family hydrolase n=1 Tax=Bacillus litorisediminis TaxID=2922713 RepID=UPI001FAB40F8|nr:carbon-nitrogen family hydrolase [Bacillus litorisediminis]HWO78364.1 carbon-nitrogen family hydrolase [Bacillus sp. (in: firmicutes)]
MKIGCIQMDIAYGKPEINFSRVEQWVSKGAKDGHEVLLLPELWNTGYDLTRLDEIADQEAQKSIEFLKGLAMKWNVHLVAGSVANQTEDGVKNTLLVINKSGELIKRYSKLHLFKLMDEHLHLTAGREDGHFEIEGLPAAGFICYDIRFPEWIRKHVVEGAHVLFVVAEWPLPRIQHWKNLLVARAIENQAFVVACNRVGEDPANTFGGHSLIIDPWGEILSEGGTDEEIVSADVDFSVIEDIRKRIPIFEDRRPDFY